MRYNPVADWKPVNATIPTPITCLEQWKWARETAYTQMRKAQERWVKVKQEGRWFRKGDLVWFSVAAAQAT